MKTAFVLGNGESRRGLKITELKERGTVFACNGVYRTDTPDYLIAVDPKMIFEICETGYQERNQVWSNYNAQYEKKANIRDHVRWFQPSLGWSSGPTALRMAAEKGFDEIYILGFDYQGHSVNERHKQYKFNNIFKDTRNYKKSQDEATFYGNWMNQTKRVFADFPKPKFFRVIPKGWFKPHDLEFSENFKHIDYEEFCKIHSITKENTKK